jgi:hypothetical protein
MGSRQVLMGSLLNLLAHVGGVPNSTLCLP